MDYKGLKELLEGCINDKSEEFPGELDSLIADTARTGIVRLPWDLLKPLFNYRLKKVLVASFDELALEGEDKTLYQQLLDQLNKFDNPPFTIQRVCELIVEPTRHYKRRDRYMRAMERCLLVVSTQEPDLTWMKSPRLTQLLEEPPKESLQEVVFDENMVNEYASVPASGSTTNLWSNLRQVTNDENEQPSSPSESDQFNQAKPANPVSQDEGEGGEASTSSSTEEMMDDKSSTTSAIVTNLASLMNENSEDNRPESSSNSPERGDAEDKKSLEGVQQFPLSRKRSSSMRESMESSEGSGSHLGSGGGESEDDARGTVLQEADSTTLGEQDDNGRDEGMEGGADAGEGEGDLEQSTPKKRRSKSPEIETRSSSLEEGGKIDSMMNMDGKEVVTDVGEVHREAEKMEPHDVLESEDSLGLKKKVQPGLVEEEGGKESEEAAMAELHSSGQHERETSTGQLERSHDSKSDSVTVASEKMETTESS